jgi:hypothetical protein
MALSLLPASALAAASDSPSVSWEMKTVDAKNSIYKLVGSVNAPNGIKSLETWIAMDSTVVEPVDASSLAVISGWEKSSVQDAFEVLLKNGANETFTTANLYLAADDTQHKFGYTLAEQTNFRTEDYNGEYLEFYFHVIGNKTPGDVFTSGTFQFSSYLSGSPNVSLMGTDNVTWGQYAAGDVKNTDVKDLTAALTYTNWEKTWGKALIWYGNNIEYGTYDTLADAAAAMNELNSDAYKIKLTGDLNGDQTIKKDVEQDWDINLNGKTINGDLTVEADDLYYGGTFTIYNGKIDGNLNIKEYDTSVELQNVTITGDVNNEGKLTLNAQTEEVLDSDGFYDHDEAVEGDAITIGGTLKSSGNLTVGNASANPNYTPPYSVNLNVGGVTITGDTVYIGNNAMIAATRDNAVLTVDTTTYTVTVKEGAQFKPYNLTTSTTASDIISGLTAEQIEDILNPNRDGVGLSSDLSTGWLTVAKGYGKVEPKVASYNGTEYLTVAKAMAAAKGSTSKAVKLLTDVTEDISLTQKAYLDLSGHTLTGNITSTGQITLIDSGDSNGNKGKLVGNITTTDSSANVYLGESNKSQNGPIVEGNITSAYSSGLSAIEVNYANVTGTITASAGSMTIRGGTCVGGVTAKTSANVYNQAKLSREDNGYVITAASMQFGSGCSFRNKDSVYNTLFKFTGTATKPTYQTSGNYVGDGYGYKDGWYTVGYFFVFYTTETGGNKLCYGGGLQSGDTIDFDYETYAVPTKASKLNTTDGTITNYTFIGWTATKNSTSRMSFPVTVKQSYNFYPVFKESTVSATGEATVPEDLTIVKNAPVTVDLTTPSGGEAKTTSTATIPAATISNMQTNETPSLTVKTDVAEVKFDQAALGNIASNAGSDTNVQLQTKSKEKAKLNADQQKALRSDTATIIDLSLTDGNGATVTFNKDGTGNTGKAEVKVPFQLADGHGADDYAVYYIDNAGNKEKMACSWANNYMTFTATHFSDYVIALSSVEDAPTGLTADQITKHGDAITIGEPDGRTFTVTSANACVVAYTTDNGTSYTRMTATATDTANTYSFTVADDVDLTSISIAVALKGDIDLSGEVDTTDAYYVRRAAAGYDDGFTALKRLVGDVDVSGEVDTTDAYYVRRAAAGYSAFGW